MTTTPIRTTPGPARDAWLRRRYVDERAPVWKLASEAGVGKMTIYRWLDRAGIRLRPRAGASLSRTWLAHQYAAAPNPYRIARVAGVSRSTILDQLSRHQLLPAPTDLRARQAAVIYLAGRPLESVALELGVGRRMVTVWLRALGIPIRRPGRRGQGQRPPQQWRSAPG